MNIGPRRTLLLCFRLALQAPGRVSSPSCSPAHMARKQSTAAAALSPATEASQPDASSRRSRRTQVPLPANVSQQDSKPQLRKPSRGGGAAPTNPNTNPDILDGISALRASPDSAEHEDTDRPLKPRVNNVSTGGNPSATTEATAVHRDEHGRKGRGNAITPAGGAGNQAHVTNTNQLASKAPTADLHPEPGRSKRKRTAPQHVKVDSAEINNATVLAADQHVTPPTSNGVKVEDDVGVTVDPEEEEGPKDENEDEEEVTEALSRPPPVNSDYLPLPWKGRLGYVG
jgi:UV DNA damage endonuclease